MSAKSKTASAEIARQADVAKPWLRQPNESTKAHEAFKTYLDMGKNRSQTAVAKRLGKSGKLMHRWSKRHAWGLRVRAYEVHLETFQQAEVERRMKRSVVDWAARAEEIRHREFDMAEALLSKAAEMIQKLPKATMGDIARAIELAFRLQRMSCGLPTDHTEHTGAVAVTDSQVIINIPDNGRGRKSQIGVESVQAVSQKPPAVPEIAETTGQNAEGTRDLDPLPAKA